MTTKLQHSINPTLTIASPHYYTTTSHPLKKYLSLSSNHLHQQHEPRLVSSMDRINLDSMRKMMLMQEQLFKHQVHELHRLYNVQKKLMDEIENESKRRRDVTDYPKESSTTPSSVDHEEEADVEVDLTLSIGHSRTKQRSKSQLHKCSTHLHDSDQSNEGSSSDRQDNTRPRWLLQDLHLNRR